MSQGAGLKRRPDSWFHQWRERLHSVFVGNLSRKVTSTALWDAFSDYGKVADVFIKYPKEVRGKGHVSFAFVRYWHEAEAETTIVKGNFCFLEGKRIRVTKARSIKKDEFNSTNKGREIGQGRNGRRVFREANVDGRTFKEVIISTAPTKEMKEQQRPNGEGSSSSSLGNESSAAMKLIEKVELDFEISTEEMQWLERSAIGKLNQNATIEEVQETTMALGLKMSIAPLSNTRALLRFEDKMEMESFLSSPGELMEMYCFEFVAWTPGCQEREFRVWLKLEKSRYSYSIRIFFSCLCSKWGTVVKVAECTNENLSLEAGWVLIETRSKASIPAFATGEWKGVKFVIKVSIDEGFSDGLAGNNSDGREDVGDDLSVSGETRVVENSLEIVKSLNVLSVDVVADSMCKVEHANTMIASPTSLLGKERVGGGVSLYENNNYENDEEECTMENSKNGADNAKVYMSPLVVGERPNIEVDGSGIGLTNMCVNSERDQHGQVDNRAIICLGSNEQAHCSGPLVSSQESRSLNRLFMIWRKIGKKT
ncbi:hypothetical protein COLO4_12837 [Corchorus olitorius]|uniref:RRM domain-containing protein n=1 Tax=Corchorus olitorius TaxID=93759 RepID=A0A1R3JZ99_9ROSI|nr:hypothetical protein COLO4_12837 [Corchorus olitorius]